MPAMYQFVAGYNPGDAISNEARALRNMFRGWGLGSEILCEAHCIHPDLRQDARDVRTLRPAPDDIVLLHLSIGSLVNEVFARMPCRRALLYHNITPHQYFATFQPQTGEKLRQGRIHMAELAGVSDVNMAVSRYNASELEAAGYEAVKLLPILLDFAPLAVRPDPTILNAYGDGRTNVLFVGRCAPNKCIDDLVRSFGCYQRNVQAHSRLIHVGSFTGMEAYYGMCRIQARNLGLQNVHFMGSVSQSELVAFYQIADVFLSTSEHEGFCIPLLESMHFDLPIVAYAAGAVPETLDGSGILYDRKDHEQIAEMLGRIASDAELRSGVIRGQQKRLARYRELDLERELRAHLAPVLGPP